ncbi:MAG: biotin synthase BioB [Bacteroidota bacterium]
MSKIRYNWTKEEILEKFNLPFLELVFEAASVHRQFNDPLEVRINSLISIKTGGCSEDCGYCSQASRYAKETGIKGDGLMSLKDVVKAAKQGKKAGASRLCMSAAWREVRDNGDFNKVVEMVKAVSVLGLEVCCTLGMLTEEQAKRLAEAGLTAYNHNLDTSEEHYKEIISTHKFSDRIKTLENVRKANITVCCGGIIGLGESIRDRAGMLHALSSMNPHPESVPINAFVPIPGTPLEKQPMISIWEMVRMIAVTRIVMPEAVVRLSAGRKQMSCEGQALCFLAGANSIFAGDKLLTTPNPEFSEDMEMFDILGLKPRKTSKEEISDIEGVT